jgi:SAM-dependent methyltransferase
MHRQTRTQLLALSKDFYLAHSNAFDASRGHQPWPGWQRLADLLPAREAIEGTPANPQRVLDIGCGNARFLRFLEDSGLRVDYTGIDANAGLLDAARTRLRDLANKSWRLAQQDFLASESPGDELPKGPFDLIVIMGVLHHVPGRDWRRSLLEAATMRLTKGGILALATWQFAGRARFARRQVAWSELGPVRGAVIDEAELEAGDTLLRFGSDPNQPPRYCHQVSDAEFEAWPEQLGLDPVAEYRSDGAQGDLNRYWVLRHHASEPDPG